MLSKGLHRLDGAGNAHVYQDDIGLEAPGGLVGLGRVRGGSHHVEAEVQERGSEDVPGTAVVVSEEHPGPGNVHLSCIHRSNEHHLMASEDQPTGLTGP